MNHNQYLLKKYKEIQDKFISNRNDRFYNYLHGRGIIDEVINKYELGYNNDYYDFKNKQEPLIGRDAITIPFRDMTGRIIAFQSRFVENKMINETEYRYFNSEVIPFIFEKKKYIYNLNNILEQGYTREVYVVEGVFDLYSLVTQGITNVVAVIGNKLTLEIVEILRKYFDKIIFIMDKGQTGEDIIEVKNLRIFELDLYKVQVDNINDIELKDSNDLLKNNIDIKKYIDEHIVRVEIPELNPA